MEPGPEAIYPPVQHLQLRNFYKEPGLAERLLNKKYNPPPLHLILLLLFLSEQLFLARYDIYLFKHAQSKDIFPTFFCNVS